MSSNAPPEDEQPIRPAATVVLARNAEAGFELFMLKRTSKAVFAGGMYVFPGGRVDPEDSGPLYDGLCAGPSREQERQVEALGSDHRAYYLAAIRECFEEAGYLLAYDANGEMIRFDDPAVAARFTRYREQLNAGDTTLAEICQQEQLQLALDHIHFYHRWITPPGRPRRFDTRFFFAQVPEAQIGVHDNAETVANTWIAPRTALAQHEAQQFDLMAVTSRQLSEFADFADADAFVNAARGATDFPTFRPQVPKTPPKS